MGDKSMFSMGFSKNQLGCCGYDDLAIKPATTSPITRSNKIPQASMNYIKTLKASPPRFSSVGTTARLNVANLSSAKEGLLQKGRREGRS
jgi:hypothetical protein